ncbi:MAG: hypothetical protein U9P14_00585 [Gemmatimonadota bacterium]|nr:hypothetical protein [Gemmatimonadota bacterium]
MGHTTYSLLAVLALCFILLMLIVIQKKKEEEKRRRELERLTAQRRLESARENLNRMRKCNNDAENTYGTQKYDYKQKKEELIQIAKQLADLEEERKSIQNQIKEGTTSEKELNLLTNRMKVFDEAISKLSPGAQELQEEVKGLESSIIESEQQVKKLSIQVAQAEKELEYSKEKVKLLESKYSH